MYELIIKIISQYGFLGVIISLTYLIIKNRPVTMFSSSKLELKLASKEKRLLHDFFHYVSKLSILTLALFVITNIIAESKIKYINYIAWIITIINIVGFIFIIYNVVKKKTIFDLISNTFNIKAKKIILILAAFIYLLLWLILPAYSIGTQLFSEYYDQGKYIFEDIYMFVAIIISYFFVTMIILQPVYSIIFKFLNFSSQNEENKVFIEIGTQKWFLQYPIDGDIYLLTDKPYQSRSTEFKFLNKEELLKNNFKVERKNKNNHQVNQL